MRLFVVAAIAVSACAKSAHTGTSMSMSTAAAEPSAFSREVQDGYARVRASTAAFKVLDSAVAKGYPASVAQCLSDPTHGAMGFHHMNRALLDNKIEVDKPEILLYERKADGSYGLNGVEYIILYRAWPKDSVPPKLMGRDMIRSDPLQLWYTHMWVWTPNSAGLFADWNPAVKCR
ncbi:MAG TPA: hypothetical protein VIK50_09460 [Gemmatimonadaceae bacterium]